MPSPAAEAPDGDGCRRALWLERETSPSTSISPVVAMRVGQQLEQLDIGLEQLQRTLQVDSITPGQSPARRVAYISTLPPLNASSSACNADMGQDCLCTASENSGVLAETDQEVSVTPQRSNDHISAIVISDDEMPPQIPVAENLEESCLPPEPDVEKVVSTRAKKKCGCLRAACAAILALLAMTFGALLLEGHSRESRSCFQIIEDLAARFPTDLLEDALSVVLPEMENKTVVTNSTTQITRASGAAILVDTPQPVAVLPGEQEKQVENEVKMPSSVTENAPNLSVVQMSQTESWANASYDTNRRVPILPLEQNSLMESDRVTPSSLLEQIDEITSNVTKSLASARLPDPNPQRGNNDHISTNNEEPALVDASEYKPLDDILVIGPMGRNEDMVASENQTLHRVANFSSDVEDIPALGSTKAQSQGGTPLSDAGEAKPDATKVEDEASELSEIDKADPAGKASKDGTLFVKESNGKTPDAKTSIAEADSYAKAEDELSLSPNIEGEKEISAETSTLNVDRPLGGETQVAKALTAEPMVPTTETRKDDSEILTTEASTSSQVEALVEKESVRETLLVKEEQPLVGGRNDSALIVEASIREAVPANVEDDILTLPNIVGDDPGVDARTPESLAETESRTEAFAPRAEHPPGVSPAEFKRVEMELLTSLKNESVDRNLEASIGVSLAEEESIKDILVPKVQHALDEQQPLAETLITKFAPAAEAESNTTEQESPTEDRDELSTSANIEGADPAAEASMRETASEKESSSKEPSFPHVHGGEVPLAEANISESVPPAGMAQARDELSTSPNIEGVSTAEASMDETFSEKESSSNETPSPNLSHGGEAQRAEANISELAPPIEVARAEDGLSASLNNEGADPRAEASKVETLVGKENGAEKNSSKAEDRALGGHNGQASVAETSINATELVASTETSMSQNSEGCVGVENGQSCITGNAQASAASIREPAPNHKSRFSTSNIEGAGATCDARTDKILADKERLRTNVGPNRQQVKLGGRRGKGSVAESVKDTNLAPIDRIPYLLGRNSRRGSQLLKWFGL